MWVRDDPCDHAFLWEMAEFDPSQNQNPSLVEMKL